MHSTVVRAVQRVRHDLTHLNHTLGTDPSKWPIDYPFCGGLNQSPVDICTDDVIPNPTLGNIVYSNLNKKSSSSLTLINADGEQGKMRAYGHNTRPLHASLRERGSESLS